MEIKPIKTEEDHEAALTEVEKLWKAEPGSPEADRLEVLVMGLGFSGGRYQGLMTGSGILGRALSRLDDGVWDSREGVIKA